MKINCGGTYMDINLTQVGILIDTILKVRFTDLELEKKYCEELLTFADDQKSTYAKAFAYTYLGDYYLAMNDSIQSGKYLMTARMMCSPKTYPELYMKICHLLGFYYHLINDEQNAIQYYMESQSIAQNLGDIYQICNAWNNIADIYEQHEDFEQAKRYYLLAYQTIIEHNCKDSRLIVILLYNISLVNYFLGDLDEMNRYLVLCEKSIPDNEDLLPFHQLCYKTGWCLFECYRGNSEAAIKIAYHILDSNFYGVTDQYLIVVFLAPIAKALIKLRNYDGAKKYIDILSNYCSLNELLLMHRFIELKTEFAQAFANKDELLDSYKDYYSTMHSIIKTENEVRVLGMNAKVNLLEMIKKHETTLKENERLIDEVNLDELTGLHNRRYFNLKIQEEQILTNSMGIIMIDIDYFKQYNDTYGHISGDFALREVALALKTKAPNDIIPCRYGGDEFICICINKTDLEIEAYINEIEDQIRKLSIHHKNSKCDTILTLSIGYSNLSRHYRDFEIAIKQADNALYSAKENGRNCFKKYQERQEN